MSDTVTDNDLQLLARYTSDHAEDAFAEIVRRHLNLVHSAALRQVRSPQLAEEVAQSTFTDLARHAHHLAPDTILTAWLYQVTRRTAIDVVRRETRRQLREQIATEMNAMNATTTEWAHIEPLLDEAMSALDETDRAAVLLRYFENKSLRDVGASLGTSDDAAQKRVSRAVERLREFFIKRGVTIGASGLVVAISANAVQAAPAGLALTISTTATVAGTTLTTAAIKAVAMTTLQKTLITTAIVAAVGAGIYEARQASILREQIRTAQQEAGLQPNASNESALQDKIDLLAAQNVEMSNELAQFRADKGRFETEREQARHSAAVFKELADQASSKDNTATNAYPTTRHVMAGWGKLGRLSVQLNKKDDKLSPVEKSANETARLNAVGELATLMTAMKQLGMIKPSGADSSAEDPSDDVACLLYGALNLSEQQFSEVYGSLQKHFQQAKQSGLFEENSTPESTTALQQMADLANAEIRSFLTTEQTKIFEAVSPHIQLGSRKIDFNFNF